MHDACTINQYFHVDFCKHDTCTILLASMGLTQACPNNSDTLIHIHHWNAFKHTCNIVNLDFVPSNSVSNTTSYNKYQQENVTLASV